MIRTLDTGCYSNLEILFLHVFGLVRIYEVIINFLLKYYTLTQRTSTGIMYCRVLFENTENGRDLPAITDKCFIFLRVVDLVCFLRKKSNSPKQGYE